jgi:hypothetical protein
VSLAGNYATPCADLLAGALSEAALAALDQRIETVVEQRMRAFLPGAIDRTRLSPWLDTKAAAAYLGITENALRLRVRAGLVVAHHDPAGRLRLHRDDLDHAMTPVYPRRAKR